MTFFHPEKPGNHYQGDVLDILNWGWDLMIAHPPCTHLAVSGSRWFHLKRKEQREALDFVKKLLEAPIPRIALENPVSVISSKIRKPDQIIQPYEFGHGETKKTCLWLKNLPPLAQKPSASRSDERGFGPRGSRSPDAAVTGSLEGKKPDLPWNR